MGLRWNTFQPEFQLASQGSTYRRGVETKITLDILRKQWLKVWNEGLTKIIGRSRGKSSDLRFQKCHAKSREPNFQASRDLWGCHWSHEFKTLFLLGRTAAGASGPSESWRRPMQGNGHFQAFLCPQGKTKAGGRWPLAHGPPLWTCFKKS